MTFTTHPSEGYPSQVSHKAHGTRSSQGGRLKFTHLSQVFGDLLPGLALGNYKPSHFRVCVYQNGFYSYQMKILPLVTHSCTFHMGKCSNYSLITSRVIREHNRWKQVTEQPNISANSEPLKTLWSHAAALSFFNCLQENSKTPTMSTLKAPGVF